jgi:alpha-galactosidase
MFCATAGKLRKMEQVDPQYSDVSHYKLPQPEGWATVYNYSVLRPPGKDVFLAGYTSCRRFNGKFHWTTQGVQLVIDLEGQSLAAGASWDLEEVMVLEGADEDRLMAAFSERIDRHHPRLRWPEAPNGWCSWYGHGATLDAAAVEADVKAMRAHAPEIRFVQIDDGFQPWMGDWLEPGKMFPDGVESLVRSIKASGFEPGLWLAPFVASPESKLFKEHPDWFVRDAEGRPLNSKEVTFPGWRQIPWYMLDGSNPEACAYLERVFKTMRGWGVTYFKLDANVWGALPFGRRFDPSLTSVEAHRRAMEAVIRGAGPDSFILGCNHAYWPSLGLIHGSRVGYDIGRSFSAFTRVARGFLHRNWMHDRLWWNDPDCLVLPKPVDPGQEPELAGPDGLKRKREMVTADRLSFHMAATLASGGMILSGDKTVDYTEREWGFLRRAIAAPRLAARFQDDRFEQGEVTGPDGRKVFLLNWGTEPSAREVKLGGKKRVTDFWTGESLGEHDGVFRIELPATSGRVLRIEAVTP